MTTFEPGETVFREGEAGNEMHVVLQGEVAIAVAGSDRARGRGAEPGNAWERCRCSPRPPTRRPPRP